MVKIAKMTSSPRKKPEISTSLSGFLSFLEQCVNTEFQGSYALLAAKSGVAEPLLSKIRNRKRAPTAKIVGRLARVMGKHAGDRLIAHLLNVVRAEIELHRSSRNEVQKADLYRGFS